MPRPKRAKQLEREIDEALLWPRNKRGHATIANHDQISDRSRRALGDELDEAATRAVQAGARGDLTYQGAGATGIVFCDESGRAFKVARRGRRA